MALLVLQFDGRFGGVKMFGEMVECWLPSSTEGLLLRDALVDGHGPTQMLQERSS